MTTNIYLSSLTTAQRFLIYGAVISDYSGISVRDINGNGYRLLLEHVVQTFNKLRSGNLIIYYYRP